MTSINGNIFSYHIHPPWMCLCEFHKVFVHEEQLITIPTALGVTTAVFKSCTQLETKLRTAVCEHDITIRCKLLRIARYKWLTVRADRSIWVWNSQNASFEGDLLWAVLSEWNLRRPAFLETHCRPIAFGGLVIGDTSTHLQADLRTFRVDLIANWTEKENFLKNVYKPVTRMYSYFLSQGQPVGQLRRDVKDCLQKQGGRRMRTVYTDE